MIIRLIDAGRVSAIRSQTIYHALAYAKTPATPDTVVLSIPGEPYVCTGFHRSPGEEIDLDYCAARGWPVIRRETGGGTVYIDDRQLFVQWIFDPERLPRMVENRFRLFCQPLIETYQFFGIDAVFFPPNDVHVRNRKIVGTGAGAIGNAEVVTGNFIFDFDPEPMARLLNVPSERFRRMALEGMKKYMGSFRSKLKTPPSVEEVKAVYLEKLKNILQITLEPGAFTGEEQRLMAELDEKFAARARLSRQNQNQTGLRRVKIHANVWVSEITVPTPQGAVELLMRAKGNRIDAIALSGETGLLPASKIPGFEKVLVGATLSAPELRELLDTFFELHGMQTTLLRVDDWVEALLQGKI